MEPATSPVRTSFAEMLALEVLVPEAAPLIFLTALADVVVFIEADIFAETTRTIFTDAVDTADAEAAACSIFVASTVEVVAEEPVTSPVRTRFAEMLALETTEAEAVVCKTF